MDKSLAVVIMAAGKGTRMNNPHMAKVMYTINHRPMVDYVVDLALQLKSSKTVVIVGWQKEMVMRHFTETRKPVVCVEQSPQLGTGHAVMQARDELEGFSGDVLVLSGDVPLLSYATTRALVDYHRAEQSTATVLTAILKDPTGYGRILRRLDGSVTKIVEHKDATEKERHVREINSGIYVFDKGRLFEGLAHITPSNAQNEYYLTDVFEYFWRHHFPVHALATESPLQVMGINTPAQLDEARTLMAPSP
jgi:UDP-N-acetylglucosamine pyrophosphorylase